MPFLRSKLSVRLVVAGVLAAFPVSAMAGDMVDAIRARGVLRCGIRPIQGFAMPDESGRWQGFNIDFCRILAAVTLGDGDRFEAVPTEPETRFRAVTEGAVDVLADGATPTLGRSVRLGVDFPATYLYDTQGFMVHRSLGLKSIAEARGAKICVTDASTTRVNLETYIKRTHLDVQVVVNATSEGTWSSYLRGRCDIMTGDHFSLRTYAVNHTAEAGENQILPEEIGKEPVAMAVRAGESRWGKVVFWSVAAVIAAEERGVTAQSVAALDPGSDPELAVLAGKGPDFAKALGVPSGWARRAIETAGNYGEIFDRHLGAGSLLKDERGLNALWTRGGLLYAPPLQ